MELTVCVGESCHLNGAEIVLKVFQDLVKKEDLQTKIELKGSFCIGECDEQALVSYRIGDRLVRTHRQEAETSFYTHVLPALGDGEARSA